MTPYFTGLAHSPSDLSLPWTCARARRNYSPDGQTQTGGPSIQPLPPCPLLSVPARARPPGVPRLSARNAGEPRSRMDGRRQLVKESTRPRRRCASCGSSHLPFLLRFCRYSAGTQFTYCTLPVGHVSVLLARPVVLCPRHRSPGVALGNPESPHANEKSAARHMLPQGLRFPLGARSNRPIHGQNRKDAGRPWP
ncbi:hypothetical protein Purlil1_8146 [Purpureocillium lilacinum]|uniref:Uncharacterized protein n=1 Tax=Purpureocillium lilacinum TaxID=33203 RepID=A0ABR0BUR7_PURLI|nr:hypothetical protein Purlil1_8146 [Purpureocillium lilacinum]